MQCQVCGGKGIPVFIKNDHDILKCGQCNHYFTDLQITQDKINEIYSDSYFFGGGNGYPDYLLEKEMLIRRGEYYACKIRNFIPAGKVLDVGAAAGFILKGFKNMGWQGTGIEPNVRMVEYGRKNLGLDLHPGILENTELNTTFDLVIMIQVIAHLSDLNRSIEKVTGILKPDGFLLVETWNRSSLTARLFGKSWHEYSPPSTLNYFNKKTLDTLMNKFNLKKVRSGTPTKSIISNHAKSLLRQKAGESWLLRILLLLFNQIPDNVHLLSFRGFVLGTLSKKEHITLKKKIWKIKGSHLFLLLSLDIMRKQFLFLT